MFSTCIVYRVDVGERRRLSAVDNIARGEQAWRKNLSGLLHFSCGENHRGVGGRIERCCDAECERGEIHPVLFGDDADPLCAVRMGIDKARNDCFATEVDTVRAYGNADVVTGTHRNNTIAVNDNDSIFNDTAIDCGHCNNACADQCDDPIGNLGLHGNSQRRARIGWLVSAVFVIVLAQHEHGIGIGVEQTGAQRPVQLIAFITPVREVAAVTTGLDSCYVTDTC